VVESGPAKNRRRWNPSVIIVFIIDSSSRRSNNSCRCIIVVIVIIIIVIVVIIVIVIVVIVIVIVAERDCSIRAYTEIIFPCKPRPGQYKKSSPETLMPRSGSYSPLLSLGTGISNHCAIVASVTKGVETLNRYALFFRCTNFPPPVLQNVAGCYAQSDGIDCTDKKKLTIWKISRRRPVLSEEGEFYLRPPVAYQHFSFLLYTLTQPWRKSFHEVMDFMKSH
jgi:hypothetical protein